jgi:hypothetical protein
MTFLIASFRYNRTPGELELEALDEIREVYGILRLQFDERNKSITIEYDASRLTVDEIEFLLRNAGIGILGQIANAA